MLVFITTLNYSLFRGIGSGELTAFRESYSRCAELRSLLPSGTPFVALTATATISTIQSIIENLQMYNTKVFSKLPDKSNIAYEVLRTKLSDRKMIFHKVIENLLKDGYKFKRTLFFFRRMQDLREIYSLFYEAFENSGYKDFRDRPFAMFHTLTSDEIKNFILKSFGDENGSVRLLLATIAFGMGVNCKGLNKVVHFGPSSTLEDYFQETGRIGRDGSSSLATLIIYPRCTTNISKEMREYVKNEVICRRKILLKIFGKQNKPSPVGHICCDICKSSCICGSCSVRSSELFPSLQVYINRSPSKDTDSSSSDSSTDSEYKTCNI